MPGFEESIEDDIFEGYIVFWTGEKGSGSLDNTQVGQPLNVPRDIGFTIVGTDLATVTSVTYEGDVEDDESGEFYNAAGTEVSLSNSNVAWITDYQTDLTENSDFKYVIDDLGFKKKKGYSLTPWKNASKLKTIKMASGDIFLLYEIWNTTDYQYTAYMIVDIYGHV